MDRFAVDDIPYNEDLRTPVIDQIVKHTSVRDFDSSKPLPEGVVTVLVAAAQSASTSSNFQTYSIVQVSDPERKRRLGELCGHSFFDQAPLVLVFCADTYRIRWVTERRGFPFKFDYVDLLLVASMDSALACQNAAMAAESLGLGCVMIGNIRNRAKEVSELLELPEGVFATIGLVLGYPSRQNPVKPRLPQSTVLHRERYSTETLEQDLARYDERMARTDVYEGRRVQVPGLTPEPEQDTGPYGWSEHTARRMAAGNLLRRGFAEFLREKGFTLG